MTRNEGQTNSPTSSGTKTRFEESKPTQDSTSTRRTTNTSSQSQEGRGTADLANLRPESSSRDPAQSTASRTTGDASGPVTPWGTAVCSTSWPTTSREKSRKKPNAPEDSNSRHPQAHKDGTASNEDRCS